MVGGSQGFGIGRAFGCDETTERSNTMHRTWKTGLVGCGRVEGGGCCGVGWEPAHVCGLIIHAARREKRRAQHHCNSSARSCERPLLRTHAPPRLSRHTHTTLWCPSRCLALWHSCARCPCRGVLSKRQTSPAMPRYLCRWPCNRLTHLTRPCLPPPPTHHQARQGRPRRLPVLPP